MTDPKIKWGERIPRLRDHAFQLLSLSDDIVSACSGPYGVDDVLGLMIASFTHKLIDHLKSICVLVDAGQYLDAEIISRSSVEGLYLLLWSVHGPKDNPGKTRPLCWAAFDGIKTYRQMIKSDINEFDLKIETEIFDHVLKYQHIFISPKAERAKRKGSPWPDDPYIKEWPIESKRDIVNELKDLGQLDQKIPYYEGIYQGFSQRVHGSSQSFKDVFRYEENRISHNLDECKSHGTSAIVFGIQALGRSIILFNNHFKLNFQDKLMELGSSFSTLWIEDSCPARTENK